MIIYFIYLGTFCLCSFFDFKSDKYLRQFSILSIFFFSIIFIGLRFHTGSDWYGYIRYYNSVDWQNNQYGIGFQILNIFCKRFFDDYYAVQFFASLFFIYSVFHFYLKNAKYPILGIIISISLYFNDIYMSQVRQSIAIGIILLFSDFIFQKKFLLFLFGIILGLSFHITAIIALPIYFFRIRTPKTIKVCGVLFGFLCILKKSIPISLLVLGAKLLPGSYGDLIIKYVTNPMFLHGSTGRSYFFAKLLLGLLVILFINPKTEKDQVYLNCLVLSCVLSSFSLSFSLFRRIEFYFGFFTILAYLKILDLKLFKEKNIRILMFLLLMTFFIIPYIKNRLAKPTPMNDAPKRYKPYYNYLNYPDGAQYRKDWCE